jgi:hypothetical protein
MTAESTRLHASGVPTVSISLPGALLTFNNSGFASPWVDTFWPVSFASIESACKTGGAPEQLFVLQPKSATLGSAVVRDTQAALSTCGVSFPSDFEKAAQHTSSDPAYSMTIWRLKSTN